MSEYNEPDSQDDAPTFAVSDRVYNLLRFFAVILLPAFAAAYFGLAQIWGLPKAEEVVGTLTVIDTLLGVVVRTLRKAYENSDARFDGAIVVEPDEVEGVTNLNVSLDPAAVADKNEMLVKIQRV